MAEKKERALAKFSITVPGGTVIERCFEIDQYSPEVRYNLNVKEGVDKIVRYIEELIKMDDVNAIYEKYDLKPKEKWVGKTGKTYKKKD